MLRLQRTFSFCWKLHWELRPNMILKAHFTYCIFKHIIYLFLSVWNTHIDPLTYEDSRSKPLEADVLFYFCGWRYQAHIGLIKTQYSRTLSAFTLLLLFPDRLQNTSTTLTPRRDVKSYEQTIFCLKASVTKLSSAPCQAKQILYCAAHVEQYFSQFVCNYDSRKSSVTPGFFRTPLLLQKWNSYVIWL